MWRARRPIVRCSDSISRIAVGLEPARPGSRRTPPLPGWPGRSPGEGLKQLPPYLMRHLAEALLHPVDGFFLFTHWDALKHFQ
jgi:hypothetical protein